MKRLVTAALISISLLISSCCSTVISPDMASVGSVPLVTFVLDDGNDTDYLLGMKIFADQGVVACSAITTDLINSPYHLTPAQILALQEAGWEIMGHTASHPNLNSLTAAEIEDEFLKSNKEFKKQGVIVKNLVYPFNKNNDMVRKVTGQYYRSGRGGTNTFNAGKIDPYFLKSFTLKHDLPLMKSYIDRAYKDKSWLIFYSHEIDAKLKTKDSQGTFAPGETVILHPSGTVGRYTTTHWFPFYGSYTYIVPFSGVPQAGDTITGADSGATARIDYIMYNDLTMLSEMLAYIRTEYPEMKIVTVDQALDILGVHNSGTSAANKYW